MLPKFTPLEWLRLAQPVLIFVLTFVVGTSSIYAAPTDPLSGSSPSFDAPPVEGTNYNSGDWSVSEQNGAAVYTFPIDLPQGRNNMAPSLKLRYSSRSPLRGGLAVGWNLHIPSISRDLSLGITKKARYNINLRTATGRLEEVSDTSPYPRSTSYRVNFDSTNTRIFETHPRIGSPDFMGWIALTADGVRHYFQERNRASSQSVWNIDKQVDPFGNTVRYIWSEIFSPNGVHLGQSLTSIEYSSNVSANLLPHAKIDFVYDDMKFCFDTNQHTSPISTLISDIPIGAAYRKGSTKVTGAQALAAINVRVREQQQGDWRLSKRIDLSYRLRTSSLYDTNVLAPVGRPITSIKLIAM